MLKSATQITSHNQYHSPIALPAHAADLPTQPMSLFSEWFQTVLKPESGVAEPEAVALSTVTSNPVPIPSTRFVLLKQADSRGLTWYTNYSSRKAAEIQQNPYASMAFYWKEVSLSVRFVGKVEKVSHQDTSAYFKSRPIGSRVGAWASAQSTVLSSRQELQEKVCQIEQQFSIAEGSTERSESAEGEAKDMDAPPYWGGYRLLPIEVEFWAGRKNRLHDRYRYTRLDQDFEKEGEWKVERLSP